MKKSPSRMCVACRGRFPKASLLRVAVSPEGCAVWDEQQQVMGRGAYVCYNRLCVGIARKRRLLDRALKVSVPDEVWDCLIREAERADENIVEGRGASRPGTRDAQKMTWPDRPACPGCFVK